jgi:hypothetical protein
MKRGPSIIAIAKVSWGAASAEKASLPVMDSDAL